MPIVTIDGTPVTVPQEATILDAARAAGVWIPTLCHNPAVSSLAACRLCMVELDRGDWKQMVTACNYPVRRDITVSVAGERAVRTRRGVMELLLARSPESAELKDLARRMGVEGTPYPTVTESRRSCILCGLCSRVCEELITAAGIGFTGRGGTRMMAPPFNLAPEVCTGCGACAAVCPVGTIRVRVHGDAGEVEISPFKARVKLRVCPECGSPIVSEPVAAAVLARIKADPAAYAERLRLCPACRRKAAAAALGRGTPSRGRGGSH
ncbi:MAG: 2Fe-2S iron-sulfur cluster-binding protein [Planctomycetota bacterium]